MASSTVTEDHPSSLEKTVAELHPWIEGAARAGYVAKAVVWALIGILAFLAALHLGGGETSTRGALNVLGQMPFGRFLLFPLALGLLGYALWRLLFAWLNPEDVSLLKRIGYAITAFAYGGLGFAALKLAIFSIRASTDDKSWTIEILNKPFGQYLVIGIGLLVIGLGVAQFVNAYTCKFCSVLKRDMPSQLLRFARWSGRLGLASRGLLFLLIGYFIARAGWQANPRAAGGTDEALAATKSTPAGIWLLALVSLGLIAYAAFLVIEARYRRIHTADQQLVAETKV